MARLAQSNPPDVGPSEIRQAQFGAMGIEIVLPESAAERFSMALSRPRLSETLASRWASRSSNISWCSRSLHLAASRS